MKKGLNTALLLSFLATVLVPLTGVHIHKLASCVFLLLCIVHALLYRRKQSARRWLLLGLTMMCFLSGVLSMIFRPGTGMMAAHKVLSMALIFFLAIHIFVFYRKMR